MKIGDRVFVRGYIDEIRKDTVIVRNDGGYFGTVLSEVTGELPSAQPEWIPCSERLPKEENKYLCTCSSDDEMLVLSFRKNLYAYDRYAFVQYKGTVHPGFIIYDSIYGDSEVDVLAWMPLPEPYAERRAE